jgi:hypothetical protein
MYRRTPIDPLRGLLGELVLRRSALDQTIADFERLLAEQEKGALPINLREGADADSTEIHLLEKINRKLKRPSHLCAGGS